MFRKWSPPSKMFAVLGVVCALAAFAVVRSYTARAGALRAELGNPVAIVVARQELDRGSVLDESMLAIREFPSAYAPPGAARSVDDLVGRVAVTPLGEGTPVTEDRLAPHGAGPVAALVPPGFRAVSIPSTLAPGTVRGGDHVDVLATYPGPRAHTEIVATELEVIGVLASESPTGPDLASGVPGSNASELLLLVTPEQAQELAYARAFADLSLALDGPEEVVAAAGP